LLKTAQKKTGKQILSQIQIFDILSPSQISQIGHTFGVTGANPFLLLFENPAWNSSN